MDTTNDGRAIEVVDDPQQTRFEARIAGEVVGKSVYRAEPGRVVFVHTEVDPGLQGQGIAQVLARVALDQVRASGRQVVPQCSFIASFIGRHPAYADLVAPTRG